MLDKTGIDKQLTNPRATVCVHKYTDRERKRRKGKRVEGHGERKLGREGGEEERGERKKEKERDRRKGTQGMVFINSVSLLCRTDID